MSRAEAAAGAGYPPDLSPRLRPLWDLDPEIAFLNHGSFGACPLHILAYQGELRRRLEREPVRFLGRELEAGLDAARDALGAFVGADPDDLAFVTNATTAVSTIVHGLRLAPGDELLTTDHTYNACTNALATAAARSGAEVVIASVPFPLRDAREVSDAVLDALTPRTRLALLDHVTSPTGLVFPVEALVPALEGRGVPVLIDGAHAPGMLPLAIARLGATYYTGNCHKWLCAPKGAAFLWVRRDAQAAVHPLVTSHGYNAPPRRSRFRLEFDFCGTDDPTAYLTVPECLRYLPTLIEGGWPALLAHNRSLARAARAELLTALGLPPPAPENLLGSLAALPLPPRTSRGAGAYVFDPLHVALFERFKIEVPVFNWPVQRGGEPAPRLLRIAAQVYNSPAEVTALATALRTLLTEEDARS